MGLIDLARAMCDSMAPESLWKAIKALNQLRNHLAHDLERPELESKVGEFKRQVFETYRAEATQDWKPTGPIAMEDDTVITWGSIVICEGLQEIQRELVPK